MNNFDYYSATTHWLSPHPPPILCIDRQIIGMESFCLGIEGRTRLILTNVYKNHTFVYALSNWKGGIIIKSITDWWIV